MNQEQTPANAPDVRQLGQQTLVEAAFPGGRDQSFRVWLRPEAHEGLWKHAAENPTIEICGVLVGKWAKDVDGPYVSVSEFIRGEAAASKFAEVTFTHETWSRINHEMDARFADLSIVGWYHSHPDFGVFLSDRDQFIQENFFSGAGQIALVVDPVRKTEGVFIWQKGKPVLAPHCWVGNTLRASTGAGSEGPAPPPALAPAPTHAAAVGGAGPLGSAPSEDLPPWVGMLSRSLMFLVLFLLGFLLSNFLNRSRSDLERLRIKQETLAQALVFFNLRPGLDRELDEVSDDLAAAFKRARELARAHVKLAEEKEEVTKGWDEVLAKLDRAFQQVRKVRIVYTLTPDEVDAVIRRFGGKEPEPLPVKKKEDSKESSGKDKDDKKTPPGPNKKENDKDKNKEKDKDKDGKQKAEPESKPK